MNRRTRRNVALKASLFERRRTLGAELAGRIRDGRADRAVAGSDALEHSEADIQEDISLALLQMRTETLTRIDEALGRIDKGTYGSCFECDEDISERRLEAMPFAVRCQTCEEQHELDEGRAQRLGGRRSTFSLFPDVPPRS